MNVPGPHDTRGAPAFPQAPSHHPQWAIKSIHGSKLATAENVAYVGKRPTWEPMEAKGGPVEVMTLPTSLRQGNPEHFSGQGKEQEGEDAITPSAARAASGEEREMEGSGEGSNFPGGIGLKVRLHAGTTSSLSQSQTELVTVAEHTPLSQWQLVEQPITPSQGSQEPDPAEEARGEILYVHRPSNDLSSASSRRAEGSSNSGFTPVFRKHNKSTKKKEVMTPTPEPSIEALTTSEVTTVELATSRDPQTTDPTTTVSATEKSSDRATTEEPSISISWVQEKKESATDPPGQLSTTPPPSEGAQTTEGVIQLTTFSSDSVVGVTEAESRSAVSESFVVGGQWTPFKDANQKSKEHKASVAADKNDGKDANNPFGILVPSWAFGLIPSGM